MTNGLFLLQNNGSQPITEETQHATNACNSQHACHYSMQPITEEKQYATCSSLNTVCTDPCACPEHERKIRGMESSLADLLLSGLVIRSDISTSSFPANIKTVVILIEASVDCRCCGFRTKHDLHFSLYLRAKAINS